MTVSHYISAKEAQSLWAQCALSSIACGVMMLDRAFGDQREWERRLSGSWASQLPLELCGQHYNLSPLLFISLPLSWSPSLSSTDSKCFYARALSAVRRTDKASAVISDAQTKAKKSALNVSKAAHGETQAGVSIQMWRSSQDVNTVRLKTNN